jgi:Tol biopolymer transport system component
MLLRRALLVVSGAALVAVLMLAVGASPGSAAFPGGNGRIVYTCDPGSQELCAINADGSGLGYLTQNDLKGETFDERYPTWSPDGRRIAFVVIGYCLNAIYVMNADRTGLRLVLSERGEQSGMWTIHDLSWSPDGNRLVYGKTFHQGRCPQQLPAQGAQLFTINVSGSGERQITNGGQYDWDVKPAWSPDGASIAFHHGLLNAGLFVVNSDGSSRRLLDRNGAGYADWSPDGTRIAYECTTTAFGICVYSQGGISWLGVGSTPAWSPDGTRIVFALQPGQSQADPGGGIYVMAADGTQRREIVPTIGYAELGYSGHPDWQPCRGSCPPAPGMSSPTKRTKAPPTLSAKVGPGFTIAIRNQARRRVKKLVEGPYAVRITDGSRRHSFHVSGQRGKFESRTKVSGVARSRETWQLLPGSYRYFCDAHPGRMRSRFSVVADPRGPYRP